MLARGARIGETICFAEKNGTHAGNRAAFDKKKARRFCLRRAALNFFDLRFVAILRLSALRPPARARTTTRTAAATRATLP